MASSRYRDIAEQLAAEIAGLAPGTRIEGEHEIAERFGVGRAAARAALQELERRMLVRRVQGVGTFTSRRIDYLISPHQPPSWSRTVNAANSHSRAVIRSCEVVNLVDEIAAVLGRVPGDPGHRLRRRSFIDDLPAAWGIEWIPTDVIGDLATPLRLFDSLDRVLRELAGVTLRRAWARASLETTPFELADELGTSPGDPVWYVESLNEDAETGRLLCFTQRWLRADAIRLIMETGWAGTAPARGGAGAHARISAAVGPDQPVRLPAGPRP
ncbi:GntR family transcriptional regulator [Frankia sp. CNm7]|uniref:GntR family transcriptional regulator n=1 Tax=Frankia nepalensis TaxID=1836974 RepID=A0A937URM0_9ACTN|nr:GntR family transcriptional regulator [Frankia nepalensis]MBL7495014.1 GntR family transcriptional regulator [Frankia nepalensis]MBL7513674.1 GntR family transcriptional regulator [Frankia nepalensis]MBL7524595.1 GntR family transcriptional regulator [Frankia nepalensis]MBL7632999.1 GntR family transcriptional regulator [Frankia nepalensis]